MQWSNLVFLTSSLKLFQMLWFTPAVVALQQALQLFLSPEHINMYQNFTGYQQEGITLPIMELNPFSTLYHRLLLPNKRQKDRFKGLKKTSYPSKFPGSFRNQTSQRGWRGWKRAAPVVVVRVLERGMWGWQCSLAANRFILLAGIPFRSTWVSAVHRQVQSALSRLVPYR